MGLVRVFNPSNPTTIKPVDAVKLVIEESRPGDKTSAARKPRQAKPWTEKQAAARKDQAERFVRDVVEDDDRADEIGDMSPAEYAESRGKEVIENSRRRNAMKRRTSAAQDDDTALQVNAAKLAVTDSKLKDLQHRFDKLQAEKDALQVKLDEVEAIVSCNDPQCSAEEHLDEIQDLLDGNGNGHDDA